VQHTDVEREQACESLGGLLFAGSALLPGFGVLGVAGEPHRHYAELAETRAGARLALVV
jgi:hypothetical protein